MSTRRKVRIVSVPPGESPEWVRKQLVGLVLPLEVDSPLTLIGVVMGTPGCMAPEQAEGQTVDGRADLFSLGVVLYRLCTGERPFKGASTLPVPRPIALQEPPPPAQLKLP